MGYKLQNYGKPRRHGIGQRMKSVCGTISSDGRMVYIANWGKKPKSRNNKKNVEQRDFLANEHKNSVWRHATRAGDASRSQSINKSIIDQWRGRVDRRGIVAGYSSSSLYGPAGIVLPPASTVFGLR